MAAERQENIKTNQRAVNADFTMIESLGFSDFYYSSGSIILTTFFPTILCPSTFG